MAGALVYCVLSTIVVETVFFYAVGPRHRDFLTVCVLVNAITNLSLNLFLWGIITPLGISRSGYGRLLLLLEVLLSAAEYIVYRYFLADRSPALLVKTAAANGLSFGVGLVLEHLGLLELLI